MVICPFFLGPGKHWTQDIPRLAADAAAGFPHTRYHVAPTLGIDDLILDLLEKRASHCETHHFSCDLCRGTLRSGDPLVAAANPPEIKPPAVNGQPQTCSTCPYKGLALPTATAGV